MAEDDDRPEDEFEDDDDSELFQPTPPDRPADDDAPDLLGDALAHGAAGDTPADLPSGTEEDSAEGAEEGTEEGMEEAFTNQNEAGEERDPPGGLIDDHDDSALFEPPAEEAPAAVGPEPVSPPVDEEGLDTGYVVENVEDSDLFSAASGGSEDEDEDEDEDSDGEDDEDSDGFHGEARQRYPWLQASGEEDEELEEEHILQGRALIIVGAGVVFVIFAALIWFLYGQGDKMPGDEDVALIEAPRGPAKIAPEDRGGIEVPDQDKLVFDRVSGQETQMQDNLLDGPETAAPLPLPALQSMPDAASDSVTEMANALLQPDAAAETTPVLNGDDSSAAALPAAASAPAVPEVTPPPAAAPAPVVATRAAGGSHVVQLGSFGSVARAETAWLVMKNRHSITLAGLDSDIQRADLGARGVFYRLRTNALALDDAQDLCAELKADGQDCLVVRR